MSKLIGLISAWEDFQKHHAQAGIEEFCIYYLAKSRNTKKDTDLLGGYATPDLDTTLGKLIGRIAGFIQLYSRIAFQENEKEIDLNWMYFLNAIYHREEANKTDIINYNFTEQSTGNEIIARLKKLGLVTERVDPNDRRARLVKVTSKGEKKLVEFWSKTYKAMVVVFSEMTEDDKKLVIQLLNNTEVKHTLLFSQIKHKNINEILELTIGKTQAKKLVSEGTKRIKKFQGNE
ncbi:MAG: MarR family winged helix-turn-helix transcriptional regulator [Bacteroidota bacterium]|nr:MarR family winged helix-turn-helix transcriptional regulator [Bacteroidota bacterium]